MNALTKRKNGNGTLTKNKNTFDRFNNIFNSFEDVFDSVWNGDLLKSDIMNNMSTQETDDAYVIHLQAVGMGREDVNIVVDGNMIEVRGKTPDQQYIKNSIYYKFNIPSYVNVEDMSAKLENGILMLKAPKVTEDLDDDNKITIEIE